MSLPLMPKATAVWLVENTTLSFEQIADFCGLHKLEVQAIADGDSDAGILGMNPILGGQLTTEEIKRCEENSVTRLKIIKTDLPQPITRTKGPRYTPISKRADKPDAIAYLLKQHPELQDSQIVRLLGTTKNTISKIRDRSHFASATIKPRSPVLIGLCKQTDLDAALAKAARRVARENKKAAKDGNFGEGEQPDASNAFGNLDQRIVPHDGKTDLGSQDQPDIDPDSMMRGMG